MRRIRRALLSVHDKHGLVPLAEALIRHGATLLSTGGTASALTAAGLPVVAVSDYTGAPEILGGRVKTLHPKIAGGLLARRGDPGHDTELEAHGIEPIDMVVVNLYPFEATVARTSVTREEALENIDIGGPTMIRAAAKNFPGVAAVTDPSDYASLMQELDANGGALALATRERLAAKAFATVSRYDAAITAWLETGTGAELPGTLVVGGSKIQDLRYGENPHQRAAFYRTSGEAFGAAQKLQGKELSFNNLVDLDAAVGLARDLSSSGLAAVVIKHTNPCGAAVAENLSEAYRLARATDPVSAFGGVVALTGEVDAAAARELITTFLEAVAAPSFSPEALTILATKPNVRVVAVSFAPPKGWAIRQIAGGLLAQDADDRGADLGKLETVTRREPTAAELKALRFAWVVSKHVKSNAIVFANEGQVVGVGAGQMSRVDSARIARDKAVLPLAGTVVASDAFFPFRDGLDVCAEAGATAVIQPGGSLRDHEVIAAADEHGMAMVLTHERHFRH